MTFGQFYGLFNQTQFQGNKVYAAVLYAQAKLETGNFKSNLYLNHNNLFGMKCSSIRQKFWSDRVQGNGVEHAGYAELLHSLLDRVDLDDFNNLAIPDEVAEITDYMQAVRNKGYAEDPAYLTKWQNVLADVGEEIGGTDFDTDDTDGGIQTASFAKLLWPILAIVVAVFLYRKFKR